MSLHLCEYKHICLTVQYTVYRIQEIKIKKLDKLLFTSNSHMQIYVPKA
jgi:hypothetical protein